MKKVIIVASFAVLSGCPSPTEQLDSIDGLAGGELTSGVTIPSVDTPKLVSAVSDIGAASATTFGADAVTANSVATKTLSVEDPVASLDVTALSATDAAISSVTADSYAQIDPNPDAAPRALVGTPVGVTTFAFGGPSICANAFPPSGANPRGAHVCTRDEVLRNQFLFEAAVETFRGAAFAGFSAELVGFVGNDLTQPIRATDCANWFGSGSAVGYTPARHTIEFDDLGRLIPGFSTDCESTAKIACCQ